MENFPFKKRTCIRWMCRWQRLGAFVVVVVRFCLLLNGVSSADNINNNYWKVEHLIAWHTESFIIFRNFLSRFLSKLSIFQCHFSSIHSRFIPWYCIFKLNFILALNFILFPNGSQAHINECINILNWKQSPLFLPLNLFSFVHKRKRETNSVITVDAESRNQSHLIGALLL